MNQQNIYKKDHLFLEEEEPIPEKSPPKKIKNQNNIKTHAKSNNKPKPRNKIIKIMNPTYINISHISRAKTALNNIDISKYENFNIQKQRYNWQKTYLYLHPDISDSFMERMEFDVYKRHIKEKEIDKLIEENKIKIEEEQRQKTFNRLIKDSKRRIEAMDNLEKMKNILNNNDITEEPPKKYTDEQWKKIYEERFKTYMEKVQEKKENQLKQVLELKSKKENDEVNLCKVKKASRQHIEKESNKMYKEAMKRKMKKEEKLIRIKKNKTNMNSKYKSTSENEEKYEFSNKKKNNKRIKEEIYKFNDEENLNLYIKSSDISKCILDKNPSCVQSIQESKNFGGVLENSCFDNKNKDADNNNETNIENNKLDENQKKIKYNFFEEEQKEYMNELKELKDKEKNDKNNKNDNNKSSDFNKRKGTNKKLYMNEVSYIIDQFFLRNSYNN